MKIKRFIAAFLAMVLVVLCTPSLASSAEAASATNSITVGTQANLEKALANKQYTKIFVKSSKKVTFTVPAGSYTKKTIMFTTPKATVINNGVFRKINIKDVASFNEKVSGNTIDVMDTSLSFMADPGVKIKSLTGDAVANAPKQIYVDSETFYVGKPGTIRVSMVPENAISAVTYTSSDPSVLEIDEYGYYTAKKAGTVSVTVSTWNGVKNMGKFTVIEPDPKLEFKLTSNKKGYVLTKCDPGVYTVNIPAKYKGKPVTEIAPDAFAECLELTSFTTDKDQETFYAVDGVLFTDKPVKTLVRFPADYKASVLYRDNNSYVVPDGTEKLGDYSFRGVKAIGYLYVPESVTEFGDYVFMEANRQVSVYVTASLTKIGKNIMQSQNSNVPVFMPEEAEYVIDYCREHAIPYGHIFDWKKSKTTAKFYTPTYDRPEGLEELEPDEVITELIGTDNVYASDPNMVFAELSEEVNRINYHEYDKAKEFRFDFSYAFRRCLPDVNGKTLSDTPVATGSYGFGYTEEPGTLIAYDLLGNAIGMMKVDGNFVFAFPGAYMLGFRGVKNAELRAYPREPKFVSELGVIRLEKADMYKTTGGQGFRTYIFPFTNVTQSFNLPDFANCVSYSPQMIGSDRSGNKAHYMAYTFVVNDEVKLKDVSLVAIEFDGLEVVYDSDTLAIQKKNSYKLEKGYCEKAQEICDMLIDTMKGTYFPEEFPVNKITLEFNGQFPTTESDSLINLDEYSLAMDSTTVETLTHEMTHAVDYSVEKMKLFAPSAWWEGRAQYIGRLVWEKVGGWHIVGGPDLDLSFITEKDKEDFFHFYYYSQNRQTPYDVGEAFFIYINGRFGEDVSVKIMRNISNANLAVSDDQLAEVFKKCVTDATCENVFQDFVTDVLDKEQAA